MMVRIQWYPVKPSHLLLGKARAFQRIRQDLVFTCPFDNQTVYIIGTLQTHIFSSTSKPLSLPPVVVKI